MNIKELAEEINTNARDKGFYDEYNELIYSSALTAKQREFIRKLWISNRLMLIVSELSEGLEGVRKDNDSKEPGSGGLHEELADAGIRMLDLSFSLGGDLEEDMINKHEYNKKRGFKHGGKAL